MASPRALRHGTESKLDPGHNRMKTTIVVATMLFIQAQPANAVRLMTPSLNSCKVFTTAMQHANSLQIGHPGWMGDGVHVWGSAEGSNADILRRIGNYPNHGSSLSALQTPTPEMLLSGAAERVVAELLAAHGASR